MSLLQNRNSAIDVDAYIIEQRRRPQAREVPLGWNGWVCISQRITSLVLIGWAQAAFYRTLPIGTYQYLDIWLALSSSSVSSYVIILYTCRQNTNFNLNIFNQGYIRRTFRSITQSLMTSFSVETLPTDPNKNIRRLRYNISCVPRVSGQRQRLRRIVLRCIYVVYQMKPFISTLSAAFLCYSTFVRTEQCALSWIVEWPV